MPIPEDIIVWGRRDIVVAAASRQPPLTTPAFRATPRVITRKIVLHHVSGFRAGAWRVATQGTTQFWAGATFILDLDGSLTQQTEMNVSTNHAGGRPHFTGSPGINNQAMGIEIARWKPVVQRGTGFRSAEAGINFDFTVAATPDVVRFQGITYNLRRHSRGTTIQRGTFFTQIEQFTAPRSNTREGPFVVLFTEEQYDTLVPWLKAMFEMHCLPKDFIRDPATGEEAPWIKDEDLAQISRGRPVAQENRERVLAFAGLMGHFNLQGDRSDPGGSMDYYRLKRGISDEWWYPINLDATDRPLDYLDATVANAYITLPKFNDPAQLNNHFARAEQGNTGFYPVGANKIWHGGIHLATDATARPVYAMATGEIVAARVVNGTVTVAGRAIVLPFSRCFVLVRHEVHTRNIGDDIDYGLGSTSEVYSLYMHLAELPVTRGPDNRLVPNHNTLPKWFNDFLFIKHQANAANGATGLAASVTLANDIASGRVFYPQRRVLLSDIVGRSGRYFVNRGSLNNMVHVEVFTTVANPGTFANSPWANAARRVDDTTEDVVCTLTQLNRLVTDVAGNGIDDLDVRAAAPRMRNIAVRHKSEWSVTTRQELSDEIIAGTPPVRRRVGDVVTQTDFETNVRPLAFHAEMVADGADPAVVGGFLRNPKVWHLHPLVFLKWMNDRVAAHELSRRSVDRTVAARPSNIVVDDGFVVSFPTPVAQRAAGVRYPEVAWNDNTYEVTVDVLVDQTALATAAQSTTRFSLVLLEALDLINDTVTTFSVVEGAGVVASSDATAHQEGRALDIRPRNATVQRDWFTLFDAVRTAATTLNGSHGAGALTVSVFQDAAPPTRRQAGVTPSSTELLRRRVSQAKTKAKLVWGKFHTSTSSRGRLGRSIWDCF